MIIITPHLQELGWLPVKNHLRYRDLLIMFNCLNDMALGYLSTKLSTRSSIHDRETRNMNDLDVPIFKTNSGQRTFKFRATKLRNDLDCKFKTIETEYAFKHFCLDLYSINIILYMQLGYILIFNTFITL